MQKQHHQTHFAWGKSAFRNIQGKIGTFAVFLDKKPWGPSSKPIWMANRFAEIRWFSPKGIMSTRDYRCYRVPNFRWRLPNLQFPKRPQLSCSKHPSSPPQVWRCNPNMIIWTRNATSSGFLCHLFSTGRVLVFAFFSWLLHCKIIMADQTGGHRIDVLICPQLGFIIECKIEQEKSHIWNHQAKPANLRYR